MVELNCDYKRLADKGAMVICLKIPKAYEAACYNLLGNPTIKKTGQMHVKFSRPHKSRSTGKKGYGRDKGSQNTHTWWHARQISEFTGLTVAEVFADAIKNGPEPDGGWPVVTDYMGNIRINMHESQWPSHISNAVIEGLHRIEGLIQQNVDPNFKLKEYEDV